MTSTSASTASAHFDDPSSRRRRAHVLCYGFAAAPLVWVALFYSYVHRCYALEETIPNALNRHQIPAELSFHNGLIIVLAAMLFWAFPVWSLAVLYVHRDHDGVLFVSEDSYRYSRVSWYFLPWILVVLLPWFDLPTFGWFLDG